MTFEFRPYRASPIPNPRRLVAQFRLVEHLLDVAQSIGPLGEISSCKRPVRIDLFPGPKCFLVAAPASRISQTTAGRAFAESSLPGSLSRICKTTLIRLRILWLIRVASLSATGSALGIGPTLLTTLRTFRLVGIAILSPAGSALRIGALLSIRCPVLRSVRITFLPSGCSGASYLFVDLSD